MPAYLLAWDGGQQHAAPRPRSEIAPIRGRRWGQRTAWSPPGWPAMPPRRPGNPATLAPARPAPWLSSARTAAPTVAPGHIAPHPAMTNSQPPPLTALARVQPHLHPAATHNP